MPRLPGDGPWRILDECPSPKHNTLRAYCGRIGRNGARTPPCICPGAVAAERADRQRRRDGQRRPRVVRRVAAEREGAAPAVRANFPYGGTCSTPYGSALMRHYQESTGGHQTQVRKAVRFMCGRCVARDDCRSYIEAYEDPPGTWGGIYAGMTPDERRKSAPGSNVVKGGAE